MSFLAKIPSILSSYSPVFLKFAVSFLMALALTWLMVPLFIRLARRLGFIDNPGTRRVHKTPTPKGGGIAIYLAVMAVLTFDFFVLAGHEGRHSVEASWLLAYGVSTALLLVVGLIDDRFDMPAKIKLLLQVASALLFIWLSGNSIGTMLGLQLPWWLDLAASVFWIVALVNALNLIDGMDGLCSGLAMISAFGVALAMLFANFSVQAIVPLAITGACLGFLYYNYHPAKVFLGDTGSMFLGFSLAVISLPSNKTTLAFTMAVPLLVAGVPLFDTLLAFWRRWMRKLLNRNGIDGKKVQIFGADKEHLHHRLLSMGLSQRRVAGVLYIVAAAVTGAMLLTMIFRENAFALYLVGFSLFVYVLVKHVAMTELWDTGMAVTERFARISGKVSKLIIYLFWDLTWLMAASMMAYLLFPYKLLSGEARELARMVFLMTVPMVVFFALLILSRAYQRVWSRAGLRDFASLQFALIFSGVLYFSIESLIFHGFHMEVMGRAMVYTVVATVGVMAGRIAWQYLRVVMMTASESDMHYSSAYARRVLVYGASKGCQTLLRDRYYMDPEKATVRRIVGIVDSDPRDHGKIMNGIRILGGLEAIPGLVEKYKLHEIIVSEETSAEERDMLMQIAKDYELDLNEWQTRLVPYSGVYRPTFANETARALRMMAMEESFGKQLRERGVENTQAGAANTEAGVSLDALEDPEGVNAII